MSSSSKKKRSRRSPSGGTEDPVRELRELRDKYDGAKDDLRRKKRDIEDLEDELEKQVRETKKARKDTQDLWNIYYTLQAEVGEAHKKNAILGAEKDAAIAAAQQRQSHIDRMNASEEVADANKLREALCAMQKSKMELQHKFNEIVLQNKKLKDATITYEPRLKELEEVKKSLAEVTVFARQTNQDFQSFQTELALAGQNLGGVSELQRWTSLLAKEAGEKGRALHRLQAQFIQKVMVANEAEAKEAENQRLRKRVRELESEVGALQGSGTSAKVAIPAASLLTLSHDLARMKRDWRSCSDSAKAELQQVRSLLFTAQAQVAKATAQQSASGGSWRTHLVGQ